MTDKSKPLLLQAEELIHGQRQQDYGDKLENFSQISMMFQSVLARKIVPGQYITPDDVILLMLQVKIARLSKSPNHKDSQLDIAGYVGVLDRLQTERENGGLKPELQSLVDFATSQKR